MQQRNPLAPLAPLGSDFYVYQVDFLALAAGGTGSGGFSIEADARFQLNKLTFFADLAAAAQTDSTRVLPLVTVLVTATGSGRQLSSGAVPVPALFGTGEIPFILPRPKVFAPNSKVTVAVANFSSATTYNLRLSFIGEKLYG